MACNEALHAEIITKLSDVIDPETGVDVIRMRLVGELMVSKNGVVSCKFQPSSPLCPIALPLAMNIIGAIRSVVGVTGLKLEVINYAQAEALNKLIVELIDELERQGS